MRRLILGSDISRQEWLLMELQKLQLPSTLRDKIENTNGTQKELHPSLYIYLLHANTTAEGEVWPEGSRSAWGTRAALAAQRAQAEHTGAHRSQAQHCPIHTGCRCEEQLLTAGAGEWVKTLLAGGKMMGKETFPSMSLLWQEGSCSGDFTGIPPWGQKHFRVN